MDTKTLHDKLMDDNRIQDIAFEYCEPGYSTDHNIILTGNWNDFASEELEEIEAHYEIEWLDEWTTCSDCAGLIRTSPDCYNWQPSYWLAECEIICLDCMEDCIDEYFKELTNNPRNALTDNILDRYNPTDYGWILHSDDYEHGWHPGQNDNPTEIYNELKETYDVLFAMDGKGQFDISFRVYIKNKS